MPSPSVFVSSTCYDLGQIRRDIREFIVSIGMNPVMSEFVSFPVDPQRDRIANCLKAVQDHADVFVLIVGNRYGSLDDNGKSITNLEYLQAQGKGIPVYIFVLKSLLSVLPVWQKNPEADFGSIVDSPKLFEFVNGLWTSKRPWIFPFEHADDIIKCLRERLAQLFMETLTLYRKVKGAALPTSLSNLESGALKLLLEQPTWWEARLFSLLLAEKLSDSASLRKNWQYDIRTGQATSFKEIKEFLDWVDSRMVEFTCLKDSSMRLLNVALNDIPEDAKAYATAEHLLYVAQQFGQVYRDVLNWALDLRRVKVDTECGELLNIMAHHGSELISVIETFAKSFREFADNAASEIPENQGPRGLRMQMEFHVSGPSKLKQEIERIKTRFGL